MSLCSRLRTKSLGRAPGNREADAGVSSDRLAAALHGVRSARIKSRSPIGLIRATAAGFGARLSENVAAARLPGFAKKDPSAPEAAPPSQPLPPVGDLAGIVWRRKIASGDGMAEAAVRVSRARLFLVAAGFGFAFLIVAGRLTDATLLHSTDQGARMAAVADPGWRAARADITDRNGQVLATSVVTASLYADARRVIDPREATQKLLSVLPELNAKDTLKKLSSDRAFVWLHRDLTPRQHQMINDLGVPGLHFRMKPRRIYPHGSLAAHTVGFVDLDDRGLTGIERSLDGRLREDGRSVRLTIDMRVQHMLRDELTTSIRDYDAIGGAGIVLDAQSSDIIAMVSLPDFDPNDAGAASDIARFNRATLGTYEMGSTFKIFTTAMALESGRVRLTDRFDATQPIRISRFEINDFTPKNAWLSVEEIFKYSSNIGAARMAIEIGRKDHRAFLEKLGLLRAPHLGLPEVGDPIVPEYWQDINTMTIAFGHGLAVSPLQLANSVAAMVNGGILRSPRLVADPIEGMADDDTADRGEARVISPKVSAQIRRLMRSVVTEGTGKRAAALGYRVGGKTGSAEKSAGRSGYQRKSLISSFVAAFPMEEPRYVVFAMLDEPNGTEETHGYATGGWVAAPVIGRFVARAAPLLGVEPVIETDGDRKPRHNAAAQNASARADTGFGRRVTTAYAESEVLSPTREAQRAAR